MLPFVGWRTGGASWGLMKPFTGPKEAEFRAVWLGEDAFMAQEVRRSSKAAQQATTILYLHGGGFSLGSVSFYSEALLRILNKINKIEAEKSGHEPVVSSRCIAVEYELSPTARFPSPLLQCLRCYAYLVEDEKIDPRRITFAGDSAGGNLAMAMLLALTGQASGETGLAERDWSQLPLPGKALLISPWADLRPKEAKAFGSLRIIDVARKKQHTSSLTSDELRDSILTYDWDYVASESLLHFAQVYAGVLREPRRVAGPIGWISQLCGILSQGLEADKSDSRSAGRRQERQTIRARRVADPVRKLARAVNEALEKPIFENLTGLIQSTRERGKVVPSSYYTTALHPLFTPQERQTSKVTPSEKLYASFEGVSAASENSRTKQAQQNLDSNPLMSPASGNWSKIQLEFGGLVTWGEREQLADDIQRWVTDVHSGYSPEQHGRRDAKDDQPCQDGQKERDREELQMRGAWLETFIERGPAGVHAWPFVSMYLAGTEEERERGLDVLARFVAHSFSTDSRIEGSSVSHSHAVPPVMSQRSLPSKAFHSWSCSRTDYSADSVVDDTSICAKTRDSADLEDLFDDISMTSPSLDFLSRRARSAAVGRRFTLEEYQKALGLGATLDGSSTTSTVPSSPQALSFSSTTEVAQHPSMKAAKQARETPEALP